MRAARSSQSAPGARLHLARSLSKAGICSRAEAARLIEAGQVRVNGQVVRSPVAWVEPARDRIELEGHGPIGARDAGRAHVYVALHKPRGTVTTRSDEHGRKTVFDLLPPALRVGWIFPVGRLDKESEGLLLFTDDGVWADRLTDPASHVEKIYRVRLDRPAAPEALARFRAGLLLDGTLTRPARVEPDVDFTNSYRVGLTEGRNRQIRRMFEALGHEVKRLERLAIGPVELGALAPGETRPLTAREVAALAPRSRSPSSSSGRGRAPGRR